jgi:adenylate cyclase
MEASRDTTVLFADVTGSTRLYEAVGDAVAAEAIGRCIGALRQAAESSGGRVVKTIGDEVLALFPNPDAAAAAAARMHIAVEALPAVGNSKLAVRIGFQSGAVIQRDNDVFGETVNLASRLVEQAMKGQILTSDETASRLSPVIRNATRRLYSIPLKGSDDELVLCEFVWRQSPDITDLATTLSGLRAARSRLRLTYRGREVARRRANDSVVIGRDQDCQLVVAEHTASRQHCTIERRQDKFVLQDHSTNGTYVTLEGEKEILLRREEIALHSHGWIAFGRPRKDTAEVVEFACD